MFHKVLQSRISATFGQWHYAGHFPRLLRNHKLGIFLFIQEKATVFSYPILISWVLIIGFNMRILTIIFDEEFHNNGLRFSLKMYSFFIIYCLFNYWLNFNKITFILISSTSMFPQIYRNYKVGHKLKESMRYFLFYALPRFLFIVSVP